MPDTDTKKRRSFWSHYNTITLRNEVMNYYRNQPLPFKKVNHRAALDYAQLRVIPSELRRGIVYLAGRKDLSKHHIITLLEREGKEPTNPSDVTSDGTSDVAIQKIINQRLDTFLGSLLTPEYKAKLEVQIDSGITETLDKFDKQVMDQVDKVKELLGLISSPFQVIIQPLNQEVKPAPVVPALPVQKLPDPPPVVKIEEPLSPKYFPPTTESITYEDDLTPYPDIVVKNDSLQYIAIVGLEGKKIDEFERKVDKGHRRIQLEYFMKKPNEHKIPDIGKGFDHVFLFLNSGAQHKVFNKLKSKGYDYMKQLTLCDGGISSQVKAVVARNEQWERENGDSL